jgi:hypothetical protein
VVVWDYFFPDCQPEFDPAFVAGVRAVRTPVVVGDDNPDLNGQPRLCPEIRAAVHGWGTLKSTEPGVLHDALFLPLALQRGLNPLIPALSVAAFGAALHPDCEIDVRAAGTEIEICYRKRHIGATESRWQTETHKLPVALTQVAQTPKGGLQPGDKCLFGRFRLEPGWRTRVQPIPLEDVLCADPATLRTWFAGQAVVIGQMVPPVDQYELGAGEPVFGCQVQALVLDTLLSGSFTYKYSRAGLAWRVGTWCVIAFLAASVLPLRAGWASRRVCAAAACVVVLAFGLAVWVAHMPATVHTGELVVAACALLAGGAAALAIRLLHERQLRLTPAINWPVDGATASTTVLASAPVSPVPDVHES